MARSSGVLPSRLETALTTFASTRVSVISAAPSAILRTRAIRRRRAGRSRGADEVAHARGGLHHVGRDAAGVEIGVVDPRVARHVLAHVVHADIHQLHRVERAAAEMRRGGGVGGAAVEGEVDARVGER